MHATEEAVLGAQARQDQLAAGIAELLRRAERLEAALGLPPLPDRDEEQGDD